MNYKNYSLDNITLLEDVIRNTKIKINKMQTEQYFIPYACSSVDWEDGFYNYVYSLSPDYGYALKIYFLI